MSYSGWGAVIAGLASIYTQKQKKDAAKDQYEFQQSELERRNAYNQQIYEQKQNSPQAKASKYLLAYYMPQMVAKMKERNKGGDTAMLDRMLADIMGGLDVDGDSGSSSKSSVAGLPGILSDDSPSSGPSMRKLTKADGTSGARNIYTTRKLDPEIEGYNGKDWDRAGGNAELEGSGYSFGAPSWGGNLPAREFTHGTGNVTTQTERGYDNRTPMQGPGYSVSQETPIQNIDLATGGQTSVATYGMDVAFELPDNLFKGLGGAALKAGATYVLPGFGPVRYIGGKLFQRFGTNQSPGRQTMMETFFGVDDNSYGRFFKQKNAPVDVAYNAPVGRGV